MIEKINEAGIKLRFIILALFILASFFLSIFYVYETFKEEADVTVLSLWPPDMVPHPPHFPDPNPKPKETDIHMS